MCNLISHERQEQLQASCRNSWKEDVYYGALNTNSYLPSVSIGSDNGLSPGRRQAVTRTNAELLSIGLLRTNFSEIRIEILTFSFKKYVWKCRLWNGSHFVQGGWVKK